MSIKSNKLKSKIVITGGTGRFGKVLKKIKTSYDTYFPTKIFFNILNFAILEKYVKKIRPDYIIHLAALSRPMEIHEKDLEKSINLNIIGTSNIVRLCYKYNIKLIYFSTNGVYPRFKGAHKENDPLLPFNNYGWSKLGGESAVQMYDNSLILRVCMTEKPFTHKEALDDVETNFIFHKDIAKNLYNLIDLKGIYNIGGEINSPYGFAKKNGLKNIKKILTKDINSFYPKKNSMNIDKYKNLLKHLKQY